MTNMENIKRSAGETALNRQEIIHMRISTTNRFLTKTLQTLCCVGALTACSAWATVVTWQMNAGGTLGATQESSKAGLTATARGFDQTPATDASHQYSFKSAPQSASDTSSTLADSLNKRIPASQTDIQTTSQVSTASRQADSSPLFAATEAPSRPNTELDEAMARTFDEEFVSVPTVQFATTAPGAQNVAVAAMSTASGPGPMPVPEMSALFPIVGLIVAISCTQILRRRRMAQQTAPR